jgi:hypothetical protein
MFAVKRTYYFIALYVFSFVFICLTPSIVHRRQFARADLAYYKDPTPENAAALRVQQRINDYIRLGFASVGSLIPLSLGCGVYVLAQYASYKWEQIRVSNSRS